MTTATKVQAILENAAAQILQTLQGQESSGWESVYDEDGNPNLPNSERSVLVFLCGDRSMSDDRPTDAAWGLAEGYWDIEKQYWRVHGRQNSYVTHWREQPEPPETAQ